jgi:hypothetical protein
MKLPRILGEYSGHMERERNRQIEAADRENHKKNKTIEVGSGALVLTSADGTRWQIVVSDAGAISATSLS